MPEFSAADTQAPAASGGGSHWLLIGGAVAAGLGLLVFLKGKSGGAGAAPAQTQTQESLATGDLAYQVQNGLGALGIQNDRNQAATMKSIGALDAESIQRYLGLQDAIGAWGQDNERVQTSYYSLLADKLFNMYSQLQFQPPVIARRPPVDPPFPLPSGA